MDTAKELRLFDPDCILVFLTTSTDHALDGFRVRAFHYLVKPYTDGELTALFDEIIKRFPVPDRYIEVNTADGPVRLRARLRYRMAEQPCTVWQTGADTLRLAFDSPQRAITPGQTVVLYDGDTVVGGAVIETSMD